MADIQKILQGAAYGLLVLDVVIAATAAVTMGALRLHGGQLLTVQSASMQPVLSIGDAVVTSPVKDQSYIAGEIISYRSPLDRRVIVSHRLVNINKQQLITAGDALQSKDKPIDSSQVIGRVTAVLPGLGRFLSILRRPLGLVILIYIPAAWLLFTEMGRVVKHFNRPRYQLLTRR